MPLTSSQYQTLIVTEVGDNQAGQLAAAIAELWTKHDTIADDYLRYLFTKRSAIDFMLGGNRYYVDFEGLDGAKAKADQIYQHLLQMRELVEGLIAEAGAAAGGGLALGELVQTAPIMPRPGQRDPNSRHLRGDPLCP
jgi:hypothetical protein